MRTRVIVNPAAGKGRWAGGRMRELQRLLREHLLGCEVTLPAEFRIHPQALRVLVP